MKQLTVRGSTASNDGIKSVTVNGTQARASRSSLSEWEAIVPRASLIEAFAQDNAGNIEKQPHKLSVPTATR